MSNENQIIVRFDYIASDGGILLNLLMIVDGVLIPLEDRAMNVSDTLSFKDKRLEEMFPVIDGAFAAKLERRAKQ